MIFKAGLTPLCDFLTAFTNTHICICVSKYFDLFCFARALSAAYWANNPGTWAGVRIGKNPSGSVSSSSAPIRRTNPPRINIRLSWPMDFTISRTPCCNARTPYRWSILCFYPSSEWDVAVLCKCKWLIKTPVSHFKCWKWKAWSRNFPSIAEWRSESIKGMASTFQRLFRTSFFINSSPRPLHLFNQLDLHTNLPPIFHYPKHIKHPSQWLLK